MRIKLVSLLVSLAVGGHALAAPTTNEAATARYFASLTGTEPKQAELTLFMSQMPKGGELHHHFDGAIYAEKFLEWIDRKAYCIDKTSFRIATNKPDGACLSASAIIGDNNLYRELLQRWSMKDYFNHGAIQPPPDQRFFDTFLYFSPVGYAYLNEGLLHLKERAIADNIGYMETIFTLPPFMMEAGFDGAIFQAGANQDALMAKLYAQLEQDAAFNGRINEYVATAEAAHANVDDANFTLRYQPFVLRLLPPSMVFSNMVSAFKAAQKSKLFVAVNIVGGENEHVSMRDYALHPGLARR
jgi:adenosine deaminase